MDVVRTNQNNPLFKLKTVKNTLIEILFIWSRKNPKISYQQGMNEILGVLLNVMEQFYLSNKSTISFEEIFSANVNPDNYNEYDQYLNQVYLYLHDIDYLIADLYNLFEEIMNRGIKEFYDYSSLLEKKSEENTNLHQFITQVIIRN